mmetsp:Transcript_42991/g.102061  ORF Transcript_42991/g.102061 Transcript_42991/m.102061 type:complete len:291 (+) Transcript_42991:516-1388(+)
MQNVGALEQGFVHVRDPPEAGDVPAPVEKHCVVVKSEHKARLVDALEPEPVPLVGANQLQDTRLDSGLAVHGKVNDVDPRVDVAVPSLHRAPHERGGEVEPLLHVLLARGNGGEELGPGEVGVRNKADDVALHNRVDIQVHHLLHTKRQQYVIRKVARKIHVAHQLLAQEALIGLRRPERGLDPRELGRELLCVEADDVELLAHARARGRVPLVRDWEVLGASEGLPPERLQDGAGGHCLRGRGRDGQPRPRRARLLLPPPNGPRELGAELRPVSPPGNNDVEPKPLRLL